MAEEKIFTIPIDATKKARVRRVPYAVRSIRAFLHTHTTATDVKLGSHLNEALCARGIQKPPPTVRVRVVIDGGVAKAELFGHEYTEFKPVSVAKREKLTDKLRARLGAKAEQAEELEKKIEGASEKSEQAEGVASESSVSGKVAKPVVKTEAKPAEIKAEPKADAKVEAKTPTKK